MHPRFAHALQAQEVKSRGALLVRAGLVAANFVFRNGDEAVEVATVARAQKFVAEHVTECRRDGHRDAECHALIGKAVQRIEQREVCLRDCLEEPVLLEKLRVFRVAHKGQVRVQDQR